MRESSPQDRAELMRVGRRDTDRNSRWKRQNDVRLWKFEFPDDELVGFAAALIGSPPPHQTTLSPLPAHPERHSYYGCPAQSIAFIFNAVDLLRL
jgi:hypothetical protein